MTMIGYDQFEKVAFRSKGSYTVEKSFPVLKNFRENIYIVNWGVF
jgi:hypothetical protein